MRFVLVHGAWHGGWSWEPLAAELARRGHEVAAPDLPCEEVGKTQADYAALVGPQPDAVVVGHSLGGLTIPLVEARMRVYLAAILPVEDAYARALVPGFGGIERDELDRSFWPDVETARVRLYPDCDAATVDWAFPQLRRQAPLTPHVGELGPGDVAIMCRNDALVNPQSANGVVANVRDLDAGHFPMLTHPRELADALEEVSLVGTAG